MSVIFEMHHTPTQMTHTYTRWQGSGEKRTPGAFHGLHGCGGPHAPDSRPRYTSSSDTATAAVQPILTALSVWGVRTKRAIMSRPTCVCRVALSMHEISTRTGHVPWVTLSRVCDAQCCSQSRSRRQGAPTFINGRSTANDRTSAIAQQSAIMTSIRMKCEAV